MAVKVLFQGKNLDDFLRGCSASLVKEIEELGSERVLGTPHADLADYLFERFFVEPLTLYLDRGEIEQSETKIDVSKDLSRAVRDRTRPCYVSGTLVTLAVPFTGDPKLFSMIGSSYTTVLPRGEIRGQELLVQVSYIDHDQAEIKVQLERELNQIQWYISTQRNQIDNWNKGLKENVLRMLAARKERLLKDRELVASLGFPTRRRSDVPSSFPASEVRRKPPVALPPAPKEQFEPQPELPSEEYEHILGLIAQGPKYWSGALTLLKTWTKRVSAQLF